LKFDKIFVNTALKDNILTSTIIVPKSLKKYFNSLKFFASYDEPIKVDTSILNIPLVSAILPLAFLTRTDVKVKRLDKKYYDSVKSVKHEFNRMFPRGRFTTKIFVDDLIENKTKSQKKALLFSGGVDSTYSLIRHIDLKPRLIMYFGVVRYQLNPSYGNHNEFVRKTYSDFARREGLKINFIDTNIISILKRTRVTHDFHRILRKIDLWRALEIPLVLLGLAAPLSIGRFNELLIAASVDPTHELTNYPYSSQPKIDEKFAWADLKVTHDGYIKRFSKTNLINRYLKEHEYSLRVCNDPPLDKLNCSACEKCFRTIASLVLEAIDPNKYGFDVKRSTFESMRYLIEKKKQNALRIELFWKVLQTLIPREIETNMFDSKNFFIWLRNLNIETIQKKESLQRDLYYLLPYPLAILFDRIYYYMLDRSTRQSIGKTLRSNLKKYKNNG